MDDYVIYIIIGLIAVALFSILYFKSRLERAQDSLRMANKNREDFFNNIEPLLRKYNCETNHITYYDVTKLLERVEIYLKKQTALYENNATISPESIKSVSSMFAALQAIDFGFAEEYLRKKPRPAYQYAGNLQSYRERMERAIQEEQASQYIMDYFYVKYPNLRGEITQLRRALPAVRESMVQRMFSDNRTKIADQERMLGDNRTKIEDQERAISDLTSQIQHLNNTITEKAKLYNLIGNPIPDNIKQLASLCADYKTLEYNITAKYLREKSHPAFIQAQEVSKLKATAKEYLQQYNLMKYQYEILMHTFPELSDYVDDIDITKSLENNLQEIKDGYDRAKGYLSKDEYDQLSVGKRNQLALDRYNNRRKGSWAIGRDYEMYCGYYFQQKGFKVQQFGIERKLEDMGRDLILFDKQKCYIVQCKYWSQEKLIREKHIMQLFGSTAEYCITNYPNNPIESIMGRCVLPIFITPTPLSETAQRFAKTLAIEVINLPKGEYPQIKCNINPAGEKIYHLPFDQQYDSTIIDRNKEEKYAFTVAEAEKDGFRRAFKWHRQQRQNVKL
ncbi:MAG: hypothetical protein RR313_11450 [Anaerovoracaceae bacterium]